MATPWAIQVLTPDYLVDGLYDEKQDNSTAEFFFKSDAGDSLGREASMHLTAVRFQPTRHMTIPASSATDWFVYSYSFVAIIPRDENSTIYVAKNNNFKNLIPADIYVGPYLIHGTILSRDKKLSIFRYWFSIAVRDAEIECQLPGAKLQDLKAPFALVRTHLLQGITSRA